MRPKDAFVWIGWGLLALFVIGLGAWAIRIALAPAGVIGRTLQPDNIIQNYELFIDLEHKYSARLNQIEEFEDYLDGESDPSEKARLRTDLVGMRQICRKLAAQYNANSEKVNRAVFKQRSTLPYTLEVEACD